MKKEKKENKAVIMFNVLTIVVLIFGFMRTFSLDTPYITQQTVKLLMEIKYILWAVLFQIIAIGIMGYEK